MNPVASWGQGEKWDDGKLGLEVDFSLTVMTKRQLIGKYQLLVNREEVTDSAADKIFRRSFPQNKTVILFKNMSLPIAPVYKQLQKISNL